MASEKKWRGPGQSHQRYSIRTTQPEHSEMFGMNESSSDMNRCITSYGRMVEPSNVVNKPIRLGGYSPHS